MPRFTRNHKRLAWWTVIIMLGLLAATLGSGRLWALPGAVWVTYELCYCPTTCSVRTRSGGTCRNWATGRLYACTNVAAHQGLKKDVLFRMLGLRKSRKQREPIRDDGFGGGDDLASITPFQRIMLYTAFIGTTCAVLQTVATFV